MARGDRLAEQAERTHRVQSLVAHTWDVIVIGGGNAALVSALSARDEGASVLVLKRTDRFFRGGNSRHTRNIRCIHGNRLGLEHRRLQSRGGVA
ncbi:FAD-binding protein [Micromonospora sp. NPDC005161]